LVVVEKELRVNIFIDNNNVGFGSGSYIDDAKDSYIKQIIKRSINIIVEDMNGYQVGSGQLQYDDYVSYNGGGSRTIKVTGKVYENNTEIGNVDGYLEDEYGSVTGVFAKEFTSVLPRLLALLMISSVFTGREVRIERTIEMFVRLIIYEKLISVLGELMSGGGG